MDRSAIAVGIFVALFGVAIGYFMFSFPEGINPDYPQWIAFLAPLSFFLGGLLFSAHGLGRPILVGICFKAFLLCLLLIVNWGAFFTSHVHCRETFSFLGIPVLAQYLGGDGCQTRLRIIMTYVDLIALLFLAISVWRKFAVRHRK